MGENCCLAENMARYVGQTVTIFTTSGGLSGSGFTGVLAAVNCCAAKLITDIGAAPSCPVGSTCGGFDGGVGGMEEGGCGCGGRRGGFGGRRGYGNNWLGSVTEIPMDRIVSFTHNAL